MHTFVYQLDPDVKGVYDYVAEKIRGLIFDAPFLA